ncbi:MAG TPA: DUF6064 family protein [Gammaproteobacteria bacterium]|nr:DUF6064 family protein [Gammaproteobacteria bacterium]
MFLPFTRSEFLQVFVAYNNAIWPFQILAAVLGVLAIVLLLWGTRESDRVITGVFFFFWLTMAVGYHWLFFAQINDAAYLFGALFLLASAIFLVEGVIRNRIHYTIVSGLRGWLAAALILYAFVIYPLFGLLITHPYPQTPLFGVAPCPTTIFTLGFLLLVEHPRPLLLAAVPLLWSLIGGSAAFLLAVPQDLGLLAAALTWIAGSFSRGSIGNRPPIPLQFPPTLRRRSKRR